MAQPESDRAPAPPPTKPDAAHDPHHGDRPADHHPPDARSPEEYTEPPGSHRRGRHGAATDVGA